MSARKWASFLAIWLAPEGGPGASGDPPAPAPPPPVPQPPPAPPPEPIQLTTEQLADRNRRFFRSQVKELGFESETELRERLKRAKELEDAEAERVKAQQTAEQRLQGERDEARGSLEQARREIAAVRFEGHVTSAAAELGIRNLEFAQFQASKLRTGAHEPTRDEVVGRFKELLGQPEHQSAFGIVTVAQPTPATTVPTPGQAPPGAPPPAPTSATVDVMAMSPAEFQRHLQGIGAR